MSFFDDIDGSGFDDGSYLLIDENKKLMTAPDKPMISFNHHNDAFINGFDPDNSEIKPSILKSVYCNYRGRVTVYVEHGQKVDELSGMLTYEKHLDIEKRSDENTEFDGIHDYKRIVEGLRVAYELVQELKDSKITISNTSNVLQEVCFFGANENMNKQNYGNPLILKTEENGDSYLKLLAQTQFKPFRIDKIRVESNRLGDTIMSVLKTTGSGQTITERIDINQHVTPFQMNPNIVEIDKTATIDGNTSILLSIYAKQKVSLNYKNNCIIFNISDGE